MLVAIIAVVVAVVSLPKPATPTKVVTITGAAL
jgi:hypothetical protein